MDSYKVVKARVELLEKSRAEIEHETAERWAARAIAAYDLFIETKNLFWLGQAVEYDHEAIEHAGEAGAGAVETISSALAPSRERAGIGTTPKLW